jgi:hypothetical protein
MKCFTWIELGAKKGDALDKVMVKRIRYGLNYMCMMHRDKSIYEYDELKGEKRSFTALQMAKQLILPTMYQDKFNQKMLHFYESIMLIQSEIRYV